MPNSWNSIESVRLGRLRANVSAVVGLQRSIPAEQSFVTQETVIIVVETEYRLSARNQLDETAML